MVYWAWSIPIPEWTIPIPKWTIPIPIPWSTIPIPITINLDMNNSNSGIDPVPAYRQSESFRPIPVTLVSPQRCIRRLFMRPYVVAIHCNDFLPRFRCLLLIVIAIVTPALRFHPQLFLRSWQNRTQDQHYQTAVNSSKYDSCTWTQFKTWELGNVFVFRKCNY